MSYAINHAIQISMDLRFPNPENNPAICREFTVPFAVAGPIARYLIDPVFRVVALLQFQFERLPVIAVPEVAVYKQNNARAGEANVGLSRQFSVIQAIPDSGPP